MNTVGDKTVVFSETFIVPDGDVPVLQAWRRFLAVKETSPEATTVA